MKPEKNFHREGLTYSRLRQTEDLAAYCVSEGSTILYYLILKIVNNNIVFNDTNQMRSLSVLGHQWNRLTKNSNN